MNTERNVCRETGCKAACCRNLTGHMPCRKELFLKVFPEALLLDSEAALEEKVKKQESGVYYFVDRGWTYFSISGDCPNLTENFDCGVHGERYYPTACRNMTPGAMGCENAREIFRLRPLDLAAASQVLK